MSTPSRDARGGSADTAGADGVGVEGERVRPDAASASDRRYLAAAAFGFCGVVLCLALVVRGSWWFVGPAFVVSGVLALVFGSLERGRWPRPSGRPARAAVHWMRAWGLAAVFAPSLWPRQEPREVGSDALLLALVIAMFLVFSAGLASLIASVSHEPPPQPVHRAGHELGWVRRREIAREVRAGRTAPGATEADVRAVIDRMLDWEVVAWVAALVAFGCAAFAVVTAVHGGPTLVLAASAVLSTVVTVVVLRRIAATKRHMHHLDARRRG